METTITVNPFRFITWNVIVNAILESNHEEVWKWHTTNFLNDTRVINNVKFNCINARIAYEQDKLYLSFQSEIQNINGEWPTFDYVIKRWRRNSRTYYKVVKISDFSHYMSEKTIREYKIKEALI